MNKKFLWLNVCNQLWVLTQLTNFELKSCPVDNLTKEQNKLGMHNYLTGAQQLVNKI